jgi:hypothetical protein
MGNAWAEVFKDCQNCKTKERGEKITA